MTLMDYPLNGVTLAQLESRLLRGDDPQHSQIKNAVQELRSYLEYQSKKEEYEQRARSALRYIKEHGVTQ